MNCAQILKNGNNCTRTATDKGYCWQHKKVNTTFKETKIAKGTKIVREVKQVREAPKSRTNVTTTKVARQKRDEADTSSESPIPEQYLKKFEAKQRKKERNKEIALIKESKKEILIKELNKELSKFERTIVLSIYRVPIVDGELDYNDQKSYLFPPDNTNIFVEVEDLIKETIKPSILLDISYIEHNLQVKLRLEENDLNWDDKFGNISNLKLNENNELRMYYENDL